MLYERRNNFVILIQIYRFWLVDKITVEFVLVQTNKSTVLTSYVGYIYMFHRKQCQKLRTVNPNATGIVNVLLNFICIPLTFNNPLKACFSNMKYINNNPKTPDINCKIIVLNRKQVFSGFLKIIGVQI